VPLGTYTWVIMLGTYIRVADIQGANFLGTNTPGTAGSGSVMQGG